MTVSELRKNYPVFTYESYAWKREGKTISATWTMSAGDITYRPAITIELDRVDENAKDEVVNTLIANLGMAELPSYWKATCSPTIVVEAFSLSESDIAWWKKLILKGMGQYFYENNIDFTDKDFLNIQAESKKEGISVEGPKENDAPLVLAAGGKDTATTLALLTRKRGTFETLTMNPQEAAYQLLQTLKLDANTLVTREIDQELLRRNKKGYLNGHVPISAYLAFLGITVAYLQGNTDVIVSNEASSDEGNVSYLGKTINHQYSKTSEFEADMRTYVTEHLGLPIRFLSFLRPLLEIQITGIFARFLELHSIIRSCNRGQRANIWCGNCAKCLSTFMLLMPFIGREKTRGIVGHDLYENQSLLPIFQELIGVAEQKPFECVGTVQEMRVAAYAARRSYKELPSLLAYFDKQVLPSLKKTIQEDTQEVLRHFGPHRLPASYLHILRDALPIALQ